MFLIGKKQEINSAFRHSFTYYLQYRVQVFAEVVLIFSRIKTVNMNPILRGILAVIAGWVIGSIANYSIVVAGHSVLPIEGVDLNNMEELAKVMPTLSFEYFVFPFLAHAGGTLLGAWVACKIASKNHLRMAMIVGSLFFIGGITASFMIPAPAWYMVLDLVMAYFPMAFIGFKLAGGKK